MLSEQILVILIAIYFGTGLLLISYSIYREYSLGKRVNINYYSYLKMKPLFDRKQSKLINYGSLAYVLLSFLLSYFLATNSRTEIYLVVVGILTIIVGAFWWLDSTIYKYNLNLKKIDTLFYSIDESLINRKQLEKEIDSLHSTHERLMNDIKTLND